ncbi:hypothetical protein [Motilimonas eburnea]|uniref:hypothetical protein n=1 Tax=Motilimonas eburnea TaxID=1737488 RepID=UPI001E4D90CF|nr:hypothetical protein [Motilimonas eburnea]
MMNDILIEKFKKSLAILSDDKRIEELLNELQESNQDLEEFIDSYPSVKNKEQLSGYLLRLRTYTEAIGGIFDDLDEVLIDMIPDDDE